MSIVNIGGIGIYPDTSDFAWTDAGTVPMTFDGAADMNAMILHVPTTGTIANVHYRIASVTSPLCTLRIQLRTVDAATGLPSAAGTLYGSSTSITVTNPTAGFKTAAVNCTGATAGDIMAIVFDLSAYTSVKFYSDTLASNGASEASARGFPYSVTNTAGSNVLNNNQHTCIALEYSGNVYYPLETNCVVGTLTSSFTVTNSGVTRRGNLFRSPAIMRACGIFAWGDFDGDCLLRLRLASDDSLLATATLDKDVRGTATRSAAQVFFDARATVNLTAATDYYVLVEGNSATSSKVYGLTAIPSNQQQGQLAGGTTCYGVSYNAGYTPDTTSRVAIGIMYDGLDDGTTKANQLVNSGGLVG